MINFKVIYCESYAEDECRIHPREALKPMALSLSFVLALLRNSARWQKFGSNTYPSQEPTKGPSTILVLHINIIHHTTHTGRWGMGVYTSN